MAVNAELCDICCEPTNSMRQRENCTSSNVLPGSSNSKILHQHLRVYFIANKLLNCSTKDSLSLISWASVERDELLHACDKCEETVNNAVELHCKIVSLQNEIRKLGKALSLRVQSCERKEHDHVANSVGHKLKLFGSNFQGAVNSNNAANVKLEVDSDDDFQYDGTAVDFQEESMDDDDYRENVKEELLENQDGLAAHSENLNSEVETEVRTFIEDTGVKFKRRDATPKSKTYDVTEDGFQCNLCESLYTTIPGIKKHNRMHNESNLLGNIYDCTICRHPNVSESKFRRHLTRVHSTNKNKALQGHFDSDSETWSHKARLNKTDATDSNSDYNPKRTTHGAKIFSAKNRIIKAAKRHIVIAAPPKAGTTSTEGKTLAENFICKLCETPAKYTTIPGFRKHMRAHHQSKLLGSKYDCPTCRHPTVSESTLRRHITSHHPIVPDLDPSESLPNDTRCYQIASNGNFICKLCESIYTSTVGIKKHERIHKESNLLGNLFDCPICRHPTVSEKNLLIHLAVTHQNKITNEQKDELSNKFPDLDLNRCQVLTSSNQQNDGVFKSTTNLCEEQALATSVSSYAEGQDGNFRCNLCESVYTSVIGIRKHEKVHEESNLLGNLYDCSVCRHPTTSAKNLRMHLAVVHQRKSVTPIDQPQFGDKDTAHEDQDSFTLDEDDLLKNTESSKPESIHAIESGNTKSYTLSSAGTYHCKICESVYTSLMGIRKHGKMHQESNQLGNLYDCTICRHPNLSNSKLNRHMTKVHNSNKNVKEERCQFQQKKVDDTGSSDNQCGSQLNTQDDGTQYKMPVVNLDSGLESKAHCRKGSEISKKGRNKTYILTKDGYRCKLCESETLYTTIPGIKKHNRMHEESNSLGNTYDCRICRHPNISDSNLRRHLKKFHNIHQKREIKAVVEEILRQDKGQANEATTLPKTRSSETTSVRKMYNDGQSSSEEDEIKNHGHAEDEEWTPLSDHYEEDDGKEKLLRLPKNELGELHHCGKCNVSYKSARGYQRHEVEHQASENLGHKYDCHCGFPASSEKRQRYHKKRMHLEAFTCSVCNYRVQKTEQLEAHMRKHYRTRTAAYRIKDRKRNASGMKANVKMECSKCKASYWTLSSYKRHLKLHEQSELINRVFECTLCGFPCLTETQLVRHRVKHGQRNLPCKICGKVLANPGLLKRHIRIHLEYDKAKDPTTGLFCCKLCNFMGRSRWSLINHKTAMHRDTVLHSSVEYLLCPECGKNFYCEASLKQHIKNIHENKYTYTCEQCGKGFDSKLCFNNHKMVHDKHRIKQHQCDICGSSYSRKHSLKDHIDKYHTQLDIPESVRDGRRFPKEKEYKCKWCHAVFPFKYMLVNHTSSVHQDQFTFGCDQCDKKYMSGSSLRLHKEIIHSDGGGSFACKYCLKVFVHRQYVTCHYKFCDAKRKIDRAQTENRTSFHVGN